MFKYIVGTSTQSIETRAHLPFNVIMCPILDDKKKDEEQDKYAKIIHEYCS